MPVADLEQRTLRPHGDVQRGAGDELLVVEIPGMNPRWRAADASHRSRRSDADAAEEWMEWDVDVRREVRDVLALVERNDLRSRVLVVFRQPSTARAETIVGIRNRQ